MPSPARGTRVGDDLTFVCVFGRAIRQASVSRPHDLEEGPAFREQPVGVSLCGVCLEPVGEGSAVRDIAVRYECCNQVAHQGCLADLVVRGARSCPICRRRPMRVPASLDITCGERPAQGLPSPDGVPHQPTVPGLPPHIQPLCCSRLGPPPDFEELPDRSMEWAPTAQRAGNSLLGWTGEWVCRLCSESVLQDSLPHPGRPEACERCYQFMIWVWDRPTGRGEWRCSRCRAYCFQELVLGISAGLPPSVVPGIGADASAEVCVVADAVVSGASSSFGFAAAAGPVVSYVRERAAAVVSRAVAAVASCASASVRAPAVVAGPWSRGEMHDPQTFDEAVASSAERFLYRISGVSDVDAIRWSPVFSPWWWCAS